MKKWIKRALIALLVLIVAILVNYKVVEKVSSKYIYDDIEKIPHNEVGLVLGTSRTTRYGSNNLYFFYRVDAAVELYENKKVDYLLISGDNSRKNYDEPEMFKEELVKRGVDEEKIVLDYAGFRTLDSIIRADKVFDTKKFTIVSQQFHNERAVFIGKAKKLDVIAYNAKTPTFRLVQKKLILREHLSRVKLMMDLVINKKPKFLGEKETIIKEEAIKND